VILIPAIRNVMAGTLTGEPGRPSRSLEMEQALAEQESHCLHAGCRCAARKRLAWL
jgi:hypothetical protein